MPNGLLSVVMVNYNHAAFLREAIESVLAQTYQVWEIIFVDDGSVDNSLAIIEEYRSKLPEKIRIITHPGNSNLGIAASYQLGISLCRGEYIGFLEPDDCWKPENAKRKIDMLKMYKVGLVYSDVEPFGDKEIIQLRKKSLELLAQSPKGIEFDAFKSLAVIDFIPTFSIVIARAEALRGLVYMTYQRYIISLDWCLWLQVSLRQRFIFIPEKLASWRLYPESYFNEFLLKTKKTKFIFWGIRYRLLILRDIIMPYPCSVIRKAKIISIFIMAFLRRIALELWKKNC